MIERFRKASESWLARGLFLFMAIAFVVMWGGGDLAQQIGMHGQTVATVGNRKITNTEFADAFNHQVRELQMRLGRLIDEEEARQLGLFEVVRERLIQEALLSLEAERFNIYVSDNFMSAHIKKDKVFQENGQFSHERFKMLITKIDYDEKTYINFLRNELIRERLIDALTAGIAIPEAMVIPLYQWQNEQRQINTAVIDSQTINIDEKPTPEKLQAFFDAHRDEFKAPEYRDFSVVVIATDDIKNKMVISDDDINNEYEIQKKDFPNQKLADIKSRLVNDIKNNRFGNEVQRLITAIEDDIGAGNSLAEIAQKYGLTLKTVVRVDIRGQTDPFNTALETKNTKNDFPNELYPLILKDAFSLDLDSIGSIIDAGQNTYFITAVAAISPAQPRTFDQVKSKLVDYWVRFAQINRAREQVKTIVNEVKSGTLFNAVVGKYNLKSIGARITRSEVVAPSVLKLNEDALGRLYRALKDEPVTFITEQDDKGIKIVVAVVKAINRPKDKMPEDDLSDIAAIVKQAYINDILQEYLMSLRNKYPVEINQQFFKKSAIKE